MGPGLFQDTVILFVWRD